MLSVLKRLAGKRCVFPLYHVVSDFYMPHVDQVYRVTSEKEFIEDIDYLLKHFEPVVMQELLQNPQKMHAKNCFHLTFDDGLREMYEVVVPILLSKGISATFFVNNAFVDNYDLFFRYKQSLLINEFRNRKTTAAQYQKLTEITGIQDVTLRSLKKLLLKGKINDESLIASIAEVLNVDFQFFLKNRKPYLTTDEIRSMLSNGFTFGAHSIDHPYYPALNPEEQIRQTDESIRLFQYSFDLPYRLFAFPFTDHGLKKSFFENFYNEIDSINYSFGTAGLKDDTYPRNIQRIPVEDFRNIKQALKTEYTEYVLKRAINSHKIKR